jgi:hypothetical protein
MRVSTWYDFNNQLLAGTLKLEGPGQEPGQKLPLIFQYMGYLSTYLDMRFAIGIRPHENRLST